MNLREKYLHFLRGVTANIYGKLGVALTSATFLIFIVLELARILGILTNAYLGLLTYLVVPFLFLLGLVLIPIGWRRQKKLSGFSGAELLEAQFEIGQVEGKFFGSNLFQTILILTLINVIFLGFVSTQTLHFMDGPEFCGTACHEVMDPEWQTYQVSSHANVKCVDCHVGEGADALLSSKLNGLWQVISASFDLYERPIPTPVHQLRPARETCEKCHWPAKQYGRKVKTLVRYSDDEIPQPSYTTLAMKIDTGQDEASPGVHWHISDDITVRYGSVDANRQEVAWIEVEDGNGDVRRFQNRKLSGSHKPVQEERIMDCVDCHNRATHVYQLPETIVDGILERGELSAGLPFIRREAIAALNTNSHIKSRGIDQVANHLNSFYRDNYPDILTARFTDIDSWIRRLQTEYARYRHPHMGIDWGAYPTQLGHAGDSGCFRCHTEDMVTEQGEALNYDCTLCHSIFAYDSDTPYAFLAAPDSTNPEVVMQQYLQKEFLYE